MPDQSYPSYINRLLSQAKALIADPYDNDSAGAAALCFEVLSLFPKHQEANTLIHRAFRHPQLIRDNRKAIQRHIDEWDDRAWQQRRRLALSYRFMSRWEGGNWYLLEAEQTTPQDVKEVLEEGRGQLLQDYLLGQGKGSELAWPIFQEAIKRTAEPAKAMMWVGVLYADQGYFAESVEVLEELQARFPNYPEVNRLWAEVRWWRDNEHRIPWIPPAGGDGRRYRRHMSVIDPAFAAEPEVYMEPPLSHMLPNPEKLPADFELPASLPIDLQAEVISSLGTADWPTSDSPVDWSYLDKLESGDIDQSQFPDWAQEMLEEIDDPEFRQRMMEHFLERFSNPPDFEEEDEE